MTGKKLATFIATLLIQGVVFANSLSETSFQIGEFDDAKKAINFLSRDKMPPNSGLSIAVQYSHEEGNLYLQPSSQNISFEAFAESLNSVLSKNDDLLFPLFINHRGPENWIVEALNKTGLTSKAFFLPAGERWPEVEEILATGKQLIIFTFFNNNSGSRAYQYAWDHIAEFPFTSFRFPMFEGYFSNGAIENELMMLKSFEHLDDKIEGLPTSWDNLNTNTFLLNHALKCWKMSGKRPNFIFYSEPKNTNAIDWLNRMLNSYPYVTGSVKLSGVPMKEVRWTHDDQFITNGFFNFPVTEGYELELTPSALGYDFKPATMIITDEMNHPGEIEFIAEPLKSKDGLTGYFDFNGSLNNIMSPKNKYSLNGCEFVNDVVRGNVLKIHDNAFIELNDVSEFGIVNNSFTMSVWFKLIESYDDSDFCILGTNENEYRKGLHINIRYRTPYFGFFNNDVKSYEKIDAMKWYHLAIRYNIEDGEQSIFLNGMKTGSSDNHPSFIGESELLIGHGISMNNFFNGYIDEFAVWERALSDEEIENIMTSGLSIEPENDAANFPILIISGIIGILILVLLLTARMRKKQKTGEFIFRENKLDTSKNSLLFFGGFTVIDKNGKDITSAFSPKIKEVFLLLFLNTLKKKKGMSTQQLTDKIWPDFTTNKAANNRGVTINKLKKLLAEVEGLEVVFDKGYWKVNITDSLTSDYLHAKSIIEQLDMREPERYSQLFSLSKRGVLLENSNWEWLEELINPTIFDITDALLVYCRILLKKNNLDALFEVTQLLIKIDDLNEQAVNFQLNYLCHKGHHSKAKHLFEQFSKRFSDVYGERYNFGFNEFIKRNPESFDS